MIIDVVRNKDDAEFWGDEFIQLKWHSYYGESIFYEIDLFEDSYIRFIYDKKCINEQTLSNYEKNVLLSSLADLKLVVFHRETNSDIAIAPDVPSLFSIRTKHSLFNLCWFSSDEENHPKYYKQLNEITHAIEQMIDVDFSNLSLPVFE